MEAEIPRVDALVPGDSAVGPSFRFDGEGAKEGPGVALLVEDAILGDRAIARYGAENEIRQLSGGEFQLLL